MVVDGKSSCCDSARILPSVLGVAGSIVGVGGILGNDPTCCGLVLLADSVDPARVSDHVMMCTFGESPHLLYPVPYITYHTPYTICYMVLLIWGIISVCMG